VLLRPHRELFGLSAVAFLGYLAHAGLPSTAVLYLSYRYGWGTGMLGMVMAAIGLAAMVVRGGLVRPITARPDERAALLIGSHSGAIGFFVYGFAPRGWIYCLGIPFMAFLGLAGPATQALMSRRVSASELRTIARRSHEHQWDDRLDRSDAVQPNLRLLHQSWFNLACAGSAIPIGFVSHA
jgi:DHA1 family tetracycline resistance protein-like MFS transporter